MDIHYIRQRITDLRIRSGISEYKMSLDLGHSRSYMQSISSGRALPSLPEFLYICDYLKVTPDDFFTPEVEDPILFKQVTDGMRNLSEDDLRLLLELIERLNRK